MLNQTLRFALLSGLFYSSLWAAQEKGAQVLSKINDRTITLEDFNKRFEQNSKLFPGKKPTKEDVLKNIIYFELATQEAKRIGLDKDPQVKDQFDILRYQAIVRKFIQPEVDAYKPPEEDIRRYYEASPLIHTRHIVFLTRPDMNQKDLETIKNRAEGVLADLRASKVSFQDAAIHNSDGPNAKSGGEMEWGARNKLLPEYYDAAIALKNINDFTGLVSTPYGLHIIQLTGKKSYKELDTAYKDFIIKALREAHGPEIFTKYFEGLKKKASVITHEELLK